MSKQEKILSVILLSLFLLSFSSCVTKKKLIESQQAESTRVLDIVDVRTNKAIETLKSDVLETLNKKEQKTAKEEKKTNTAHENESINVIGTLEPKEKETSVSVGGTTIKNNGGNVSFEITSIKEYKAEIESLSKEFIKVIDEERNARISSEINLQQQIDYLVKENEVLKHENEIRTEEVNKKGLPIWIWITLGLVCLFFVLRFIKKTRFPYFW